MKKLIKLLLAAFILLLFAVPSQAQFKKVPGIITDDLPTYPINTNRRSFKNPKNCTQDTVEYPRYKATAFNSIAVRTGGSLGQFYTSPKKGITLTGLTLYSWSLDSATIKIACHIYKAGVDSLPSGSPLTSDTITIDSAFGGGMLSVLEKKFKFKSSVTMYDPYVIVIAAAENNKRAGVVANSWANADGIGENLLCGSVSGTWYNGLNLNVGGTTLDADMQFYPHVKYDLGAEFAITDSCYNYLDTVRFKNYTHDSTVVSNKYYNRYKYYVERYNNPIYENICYRWNFGEYNTTVQSYIGQNKYTNPGNYTVRMIATNYSWRSGTCIDTNYLDIKFKPTVPSIYGNDKVCSGDSSDLVAYSLNVKDYEWFHGVFDSLPFHTSNVLNTGSTPIMDTVYARAVNGTCVSGKQQKIYSVNENPMDPTVTHDSVCTQSKANLTAKSNVGVINWYSTPTSNTIIHTGEVYQTGILSSDFTYYVEALNNGCKSPNRIPVTAYVSSSFAPDAPTVSNDTTLCLRSSNTLNLSASVLTNDVIRWYTVPSGGSFITTGTSYTYNTSGIGTKSFYVEAWNGTCPSSREAINIETSDFPDFFNLENDTICKGKNALLKAVVLTGEVNWFTVSSNGTPVHNGLTYDLINPSAGTKYYAEASKGICINPVREEIVLVVNDYFPFSEKNSDQICAKSSANLSAKVANGTINWYEELTGGSPVHSGEIFKTPVLLYSKDYYVETSNEGCTSPREKVSAIVLPRPVAGFEYNTSWLNTVNVSPITTTGVTTVWEFGDGNTSTNRSAKHTYASGGDYTILHILTSNSNGCKDTASVNLNLDFTTVDDVNKISYTLYPNPTKGSFSISSNEFKGNSWTFSIIDITGKVVDIQEATPANGKVDLNINQNGLYIINGVSKDSIIQSKILVQ